MRASYVDLYRIERKITHFGNSWWWCHMKHHLVVLVMMIRITYNYFHCCCESWILTGMVSDNVNSSDTFRICNKKKISQRTRNNNFFFKIIIVPRVKSSRSNRQPGFIFYIFYCDLVSVENFPLCVFGSSRFCESRDWNFN